MVRELPRNDGTIDLKTRSIYFPYIRVPESTWMTQMLLYWDQVCSIVPHDYIAEPALLGPRMRELVSSELVVQIQPGRYIHDLDGFDQAFGRYLDSLSSLAGRRDQHIKGVTTLIHMEKLGPLMERLVEAGLATESEYPWIAVESATAGDFMAYLAAVLGRFDDIDADPLTDERSALDALATAGVIPAQVPLQLDALRLRVLDGVFPTPLGHLSVSDLADFRNETQRLLPDFRRLVEREIIELAQITDVALQERRLAIFEDEARDRIREIRSRMSERGWRTVMWRVTAAVAVNAVQLLGLAKAVADAARRTGDHTPSGAFAYAAYLHQIVDDRTPDSEVA